MQKISIAEVKRFFAGNIGREIEAEWPEIKVIGNLGDTAMKHPRTKRTIKSVKGNEIQFDTEKGISYLKFGKGDYVLCDDINNIKIIEFYCGLDNKLAVRYFA